MESHSHLSKDATSELASEIIEKNLIRECDFRMRRQRECGVRRRRQGGMWRQGRWRHQGGELGVRMRLQLQPESETPWAPTLDKLMFINGPTGDT